VYKTALVGWLSTQPGTSKPHQLTDNIMVHVGALLSPPTAEWQRYGLLFSCGVTHALDKPGPIIYFTISSVSHLLARQIFVISEQFLNGTSAQFVLMCH